MGIHKEIADIRNLLGQYQEERKRTSMYGKITFRLFFTGLGAGWYHVFENASITGLVPLSATLMGLAPFYFVKALKSCEKQEDLKEKLLREEESELEQVFA